MTECIGKFINWGDQSETEGAQGSQSFLTQVITVIKELPARVWEWLQNAIARVGEFFGNIINTAASKASEFVSTVINFVGELPGKIWNGIVGAVSSVASWGSQLLSAGINAAHNLVNGIWNTICGLSGKMLNIGGDLVRGLWDGRVAVQAHSRIKFSEKEKFGCSRLGLKSKIEVKKAFLASLHRQSCLKNKSVKT